jgi:hypothetical protein
MPSDLYYQILLSSYIPTLRVEFRPPDLSLSLVFFFPDRMPSLEHPFEYLCTNIIMNLLKRFSAYVGWLLFCWFASIFSFFFYETVFFVWVYYRIRWWWWWWWLL